MNRVLRWLINRQNARRSRQLADLLAPELSGLPPASRLLEVGAGRGGLSALLLQRCRPSRIVITDFDSAQVEAARRWLAGELGRLPDAVELRTADLMALPFPDSSFDGIFAIGVLHHVETSHSEFVRRPDALREVQRVLAPGGLFVYSEFTRTAEIRETLLSLGFSPLSPTRRVGHQELEVYRRGPTAGAGPSGAGGRQPEGAASSS